MKRERKRKKEWGGIEERERIREAKKNVFKRMRVWLIWPCISMFTAAWVTRGRGRRSGDHTEV